MSGRAYTRTLSYSASGSANFTVRDGRTVIARRDWTDNARPMRSGNAIDFYIKANAGDRVGNKIAMTINMVEGAGVAEFE